MEMEEKMCGGFLYSPYFLSLIPWFDGVTGPGIYSAGVKTGLADCSGSTPFSIPPGGHCSPSPLLLIAPRGGLYPWIVIHLCFTALGCLKAGLATCRGQAQAASGGKAAEPCWRSSPGMLSRSRNGARWC